MQITAKLNNLRMSSRKVRLAANLVKGLSAKEAKAQLQFMNKKAAKIILKLLNSGTSNAKHNFNLDENNLFIEKLIVEAGPSLKRWLPRAMGRATPILKRTSAVSLVLSEVIPTTKSAAPKKAKPVKERETEKPIVEKEETISAMPEENELRVRPIAPPKPYGASSESKKRFFSRQTFKNVKKVFRRKSI